MSESFKLDPIDAWSHWPLDRLRTEKEAAPRAFARGFEMRAFTDDERMFPSFSMCFNPAVRVADIKSRGWPTFVGCDLAGKKRPGNVIFAGAMDPQTHHRYPLEIHAGKWTSTQMARRMFETHDRMPNCRCIMVEDNGYQESLIDWIKTEGNATWWWKIEAFTTGANKSSMEIGLPSLELEFNKRMWQIPEGEWKGHPLTCTCGWCTWKSEMTDYPMSASTDTVMACWFFREAISRWGGAGTSKGVVGSGFNVR